MIPKENRFTGNRSIERVYKSARPIRSGLFTIRVKESSQDNYRLAVVVSKKVSKSAVVRNRIRRRVFELVRKNIDGSPGLKGQEIIITVFEEKAAAMRSEELAAQLENLFKKAKI